MEYRNGNGSTYNVLAMNIEKGTALLEKIDGEKQYLVARGFDLNESSWSGASYYDRHDDAYVEFHLDCLERTRAVNQIHVARLMNEHEIKTSEVNIVNRVMFSYILEDNLHFRDAERIAYDLSKIYSGNSNYYRNDTTEGHRFANDFLNILYKADDTDLLVEYLESTTPEDLADLMKSFYINKEDHASLEKAKQRTIDDALFAYNQKLSKSDSYY